MTNLPQKEQIRTAINEYCTAKGISKTEFGTQINVSPTFLSQIETRKSDHITEKVWRKIWNKVSNGNETPLIKTNDYSTCEAVCLSAQKNHFMIGLIADTGMGKTTAVSAYSLRRNVFYVVFDKSMNAKNFFLYLLREMGIPFQGSLHDMINRIADELNTISSPLLIIDEAGKLTHAMILYLHVLRDKTCKNCGIVLVGMPYFKDNLKKFSDKGKEGYAEFNSRVSLWQELKGLSRTEVASICKIHGIEDNEVVREMQGKRRFRDLYNEILLYNLQNDAA